MDRIGADFYGVVEQIHKQLGANAVPIVIPIGAEHNFAGVIDLVTNKALYFEEKNRETVVVEKEVPVDMRATTDQWRRHLLEKSE